MVGTAGFEPAVSRSQTERLDRASLRSDKYHDDSQFITLEKNLRERQKINLFDLINFFMLLRIKNLSCEVSYDCS